MDDAIPILVAAGILIHGDRILICQGHRADPYGLQWEFPLELRRSISRAGPQQRKRWWEGGLCPAGRFREPHLRCSRNHRL